MSIIRLNSVVAMMFMSIVCAESLGASLVPSTFINSVVALGMEQPHVVPGQPCVMQWVTEGTGFLYGHLTVNDPDPTKREYEVYLVTNRHVIEEHPAVLAFLKANLGQNQELDPGCLMPTDEDSIGVRMNPVKPSLPGRQFKISTKDWTFHPDKKIDVAVALLNGAGLKAQGVLDSAFRNDEDAADKEKLKTIGVTAGDGVFVLGFPMNLAGLIRNYVIVRQGIIARISDMLDGVTPNYLLDAFIFPGNSGSPVILKIEFASIQGTPSQTRTYLIGMVRSYQPYTDVAISPQTKRARITFEENSGLAEVLPVDYIEEAIKAAQTQQKR